MTAHALRTSHYYHHTTGTHGHLSGGALVAVLIVVALIAGGVYLARNRSN